MAKKLLVPGLLLLVIATIAWRFWPEPEPARAGQAAGPGAGAAQIADGPRGSDLTAAGQTAAQETASPGVERSAAAEESAPDAASKAAGAGPVLPPARVVDDRGRGVAGARIVQSLNIMGNRMPMPGAEEVTSDADGFFVPPALDRSELELRVLADGFQPKSVSPGELQGGSGADVVEIALVPGPVLAGRVVDERGSPVAGARLKLEPAATSGLFIGNFAGDEQATPDAVTDELGEFRLGSLELGAYALSVDADQHPSKRFEGFTERAGLQSERLTLQLEAGGSIAGRVQGVPGGEHESLQVVARRVAGSSGGMEGLVFAGTADGRAPLESDGGFELQGLRADEEYDLQLEQDTETLRFSGGRRSDVVRARCGDRGVTIAYTGGAVLEFRVVDAASGEPVENFEARVGPEWSRDLRQPPVGDAWVGGVCRIEDLDSEGMPGIDAGVQLMVQAPGFDDLLVDDLELVPGETLDLGRLELRSAPPIEVTVVDMENGEPLSGARVTLRVGDDATGGRVMFTTSSIGDATLPDELDFGERQRRERTDASGVAVLTSFPGEVASVEVSRSGFATERLEDIALPKAGPLELQFELGRGGEVTVHVRDDSGAPVEGAEVEHRTESTQSIRGLPVLGRGGESTDANGVVRFDHLEPGVHEFRLSPGSGAGGNFAISISSSVAFEGMDEDDGEWTEVVVQHGSESEIELRAERQLDLRGRVLEGGAPLVGASISLRRKNESPAPFDLAGLGLGGDAGVRTDGSGSWEQSGLEAGRYTLTVRHPRRSMPAEFELELDSVGQRFDVDLAVSILAGRVTDAAGDPVEGAAVRASRAQAPDGPVSISFVRTSSSGGGTSTQLGAPAAEGALTDADGRWELRGVQPDVELTVEVDPPASNAALSPGRIEDVVVGEGQRSAGLDLQLSGGAAVRVAVVDPTGQSFEGAFVRAVAEGSGGQSRFELVDSSGLVTLSGLEPGTWTVTARALQAGPGVEEAEQAVTLEAGEELEITLELVE